jgi:hypothetical protein
VLARPGPSSFPNSAQPGERTEDTADRERGTHGLLDVARRLNVEQEPGLAGAGVRDPMEVSPADHGGVAWPEDAVLAAGSEANQARHDLETLVLTDVEMPGDEAARFEADLGSE